MRFPLLIAIIVLVVNALVDLYIYCAIHSATRKRFWHRLQAVSAVVLALGLVAMMILPKRSGSDTELHTVMWMLYAYLSVYIPKYVFVVFDVLSRLPMLWRGHRWRWVSWIGVALALAIFVAMWWGALVDKNQIEVVEQQVPVAQLPRQFDGLTIAQISDLHLGTFGHDTTFVDRLVDRINSLHPDVIVFTGDIVNRRSAELKPFMSTLSRLRAPYGVYSVLGNHDYGDYSTWPSEADKARNLASLCRMQGQMGWKMLNNSTAWIERGADSLAIIGVENIGDGPFKTYGDLSKAYPDIADSHVKILLSHNPSHWQRDISDNPHSNIALTLSGHTHAMQVRVLGWSPAAWRYRLWQGMHRDQRGQCLYVNIGAGEVGFPARVGAIPEITLFTLKTSQ